ncbi:MAG: hypothetical protein RLZZ26_459 [Candidatus Parcubacteria bacterium]|jgi:dCMP deaminase
MRSKKSATSKAIVAYVPALHAGYVTFFTKHSGENLFILDRPFVALTPRMERDIRALAPEEAKSAAESLRIFSSVEILRKPSAKRTLKSYGTFILPDEDVSRTFAKAFLKGKKVSYESVFLRWDRIISTTEFEVPAGRVVSTKSVDVRRLRAAVGEAGKSADWWRRIGAVLVKGKSLALRAYNRHLPSDLSVGIMGDPRSNFDYGEQPEIYTSIHAEADVIAQAAQAGVKTKGADIYVTTFPCPNCARLLVRAGVRRVFYAQGYSKLDAEQILSAAGVEIVLVKTSS